MKCGISKSSGSHFYEFFGGKVRITLFPQYPHNLEMSIAVFKWYRVLHFGEHAPLEKNT